MSRAESISSDTPAQRDMFNLGMFYNLFSPQGNFDDTDSTATPLPLSSIQMAQIQEAGSSPDSVVGAGFRKCCYLLRVTACHRKRRSCSQTVQGGGPYHFWSEGRVNLFPLQLFPVDLSKQRMLADVSSHAQPLLRFSHKKLQRSREGLIHFCRVREGGGTLFGARAAGSFADPCGCGTLT